ncbi:hypothetical protein HOK51_07600 [Candidatus Woesearchaeota archaeon]|jgi:hypothetical protein|nr:hypothetical protein [Candidatus Woesearchaeota archaeon]MBT6519688.1 hypothetical protein [Candidatus Woesearchaeota archaeon]MBT7367379.1 hypothetical protein [Candidatus Woesearchaeota archaeon]
MQTDSEYNPLKEFGKVLDFIIDEEVLESGSRVSIAKVNELMFDLAIAKDFGLVGTVQYNEVIDQLIQAKRMLKQNYSTRHKIAATHIKRAEKLAKYYHIYQSTTEGGN